MISFCKRRWFLLVLMLLPGLLIAAMEVGSTVRIELQNGSIIIGIVEKKLADTALIRTRYGVFTVKLVTVKTTVEIAPPPRTTVNTNTNVPAAKAPSRKIRIGLSGGLVPVAGDLAPGLTTGFSPALSVLAGTNALRWGGRIGYARHQGTALTGSRLDIFSAEAVLHFRYARLGPVRFQLEASLGLAHAAADMPWGGFAGLRFACGIRTGAECILSTRWSFSLEAGLHCIPESGATLLAIPLTAGIHLYL